MAFVLKKQCGLSGCLLCRIARWRGRLLSYEGMRFTFLNTYLDSIHIYLLFIIKFPRLAIDMINSLWDISCGKYHLANWQLVSQKKEMRGLGIPHMRSLNLALLSSWSFGCHLNAHFVWTKIVDFKYKIAEPKMFG